jgi:hypothetical protein
MVRISNGRDRHKIESEYRQRFGIRWGTLYWCPDIGLSLHLVNFKDSLYSLIFVQTWLQSKLSLYRGHQEARKLSIRQNLAKRLQRDPVFRRIQRRDKNNTSDDPTTRRSAEKILAENNDNN